MVATTERVYNHERASYDSIITPSVIIVIFNCSGNADVHVFPIILYYRRDADADDAEWFSGMAT
jgi:hypothetical protein